MYGHTWLACVAIYMRHVILCGQLVHTQLVHTHAGQTLNLGYGAPYVSASNALINALGLASEITGCGPSSLAVRTSTSVRRSFQCGVRQHDVRLLMIFLRLLSNCI